MNQRPASQPKVSTSEPRAWVILMSGAERRSLFETLETDPTGYDQVR